MAILIEDIKTFGAFGVGNIEAPQSGTAIFSFIAEETTDVDDLPTNYSNPLIAVGSKAKCMEDSATYYLPSTGVWTATGSKPTAEAVASIEITQEPAVTKYYYGDALDTTGFAGEATYNNKRQVELGVNDVTFSVDHGTTSSLVTTSSTVTVTYSGQTDTYSINCYKKLKSLVASGMTTTYTAGQELSTNDLVITAKYDGASDAVISADDYVLDYQGLEEGQVLAVDDDGKKLLVSYTAKTAGLPDITKEVEITLTVTAE